MVLGAGDADGDGARSEVQTLEQYLASTPNHRMSEPEAALVCGGVAAALAHCHSRSVAHRDVCTGNITLRIARPFASSGAALSSGGSSGSGVAGTPLSSGGSGAPPATVGGATTSESGATPATEGGAPAAEAVPATEGSAPPAGAVPAAEGSVPETGGDGVPAVVNVPSAEDGAPAASAGGVPTVEGVQSAEGVPTGDGVPTAESVPTVEGVSTAEGAPTAEGVPTAEVVLTAEGGVPARGSGVKAASVVGAVLEGFSSAAFVLPGVCLVVAGVLRDAGGARDAGCLFGMVELLVMLCLFGVPGVSCSTLCFSPPILLMLFLHR